MSEPQPGQLGTLLVGREQELGELKASLADAISGRGRVIMLAGEPGIGKTRISQELAAYATSQGMQVFWGSCYEWQGAPSYWPWIQIIRSCTQGHTAEYLKERLGTGAADIAEIVPELRRLIPGLTASPSLEPEEARFRLFDSIVSFLKRASQEQPLAVVLDDLQWSDRPSLLLLEFLAQNLQDARLLVLGTYREAGLTRQHPLSNTLGELTRQPNFLRLPLRGIDQEAVGILVHGSLGLVPSQEIVAELHSRTQGNPLFLTEMLRLISDERSIDAESLASWKGEVPQGVRDVINRRLNSLSDGCNQALLVASVVGQEFTLRVLGKLMDDTPQHALLDTLEEALAADVIREVPNAVGRYQFSHVLIQDVLAATLSAARRAILHGRVGEVLEQVYGPDSALHSAELARHFAEAAPVMGTDKIVRYSIIAGEQALSAYAYEDAIDHFQRVLDAKQGKPVDAESASVLFGLARARGAAGQIHESWDTMRRAFDYYLEAEDIERAVAAARFPLFYTPGLKDAAHMVSQALTLVPSDSIEAGFLLTRYGLLVHLETGDYARAQDALSSALALARQEGHISLEIQAVTNAADVDWYHMRWQQVISRSTQAIELARNASDANAEIWPRFLAAGACWFSGIIESASQYADTMLELSEKLRNRGFLANALAWKSIIAMTRGDWDAAREFTDRGLSVQPDFFWPLGPRIMLEYETGNYQAGQVFLNRLLEIARRTPAGPTGEHAAVASLIPQIAYLTGDESQLDIAKGAAEVVLSSPRTPPLIATTTRIGRGLMAAIQQDTETAEECYAALLSLRGSYIDDTIVSIDRALGILSSAMGAVERAFTHFDEALAICRKGGILIEIPRVCYDYASMLLQTSKSSGERANSLIDEGLAITRELGMRPLMAKMISLQEKALSLQGAPAASYPDGLTQREVDVLRLIAAGKSNQRIADDLVISIHTVIYHVRNIFSKTASANRAEATAYAIRHGLEV